MSRTAIAVLVSVVFALGIVFGMVVTKQHPARQPEIQPMLSVASSTLTIRQGMYRETAALDGDPVGHIVSLTGVVSSTLLVTHEIREQDRGQLPLLGGELLRRDGFVFAGLTDELLFVRQWDQLQIQRQIHVENETPGTASDILPLEVIATFSIGEKTAIRFE
jgi:hypothetical protein